jgi:hypothetical protein
MKPEEQRKIIAELCGWSYGSRFKGSVKVWHNGNNVVYYDNDLPDYLNSLDAMR